MNVTKLKDTLTVLALLGVPIGGSWAIVAAFWKATTQQVSLHLLMLFAASAVSTLVLAGLCIWRQHRDILSLRTELRNVRTQLTDSSKRPHRFQDECTIDQATGMYRHNTKPGYFCVACAAENDRESPMKTEKDGWGWSCPVESKHFVRGPNWRHPQPVMVRNRWMSGF